MPDSFDDLFTGLDQPRPLPDGLRVRLEATLAGQPLPEHVRADVDAGLLLGVDQPRPLPDGLRARLTATLTRGAARRAWLRPTLAAAAVVLVVASAVAVVADRGDERAPEDEVAAGAPAPTTPSTAAATGESVPQLEPAPATGGAAAESPPGGAPSSAGRSAAGGGATAPASAAAETRTASDAPAGPPPPFTGERAVAAEAEATSAAPGAAPSSTTPPLRIGVVGGDDAQVAAFRAYVELTNRGGGIRGRALELVGVGAETPTGVLATVNLGTGTVPAAVRASRPLLESLAATEPVLRGDVFGFSSAPERQGHLIADAVYPAASPGATALVVHDTSGVFAGAVPDAIEAALRARAVMVTRLAFDRATTTAFPPADAVFLSLTTDSALVWLQRARDAGYAPRLGINGIYSLHDETLVDRLPEGARIISPYRLPTGDEANALRTGTRRPITAASLHGWATAKALAVALWRSGADTAAEVHTALEGLAGFDGGLSPPYEVRPGTRSRTPEGLLITVRRGAFVAEPNFRRDPF